MERNDTALDAVECPHLNTERNTKKNLVTEWVQRQERGRKMPELWMEGWIGGIAEGGGGERMNVSSRDGILWPPGLTAAPLRTTTKGLELQPVYV